VSVWVFGYHRVGWKLCEALIARKIAFAVVDSNPHILKTLHERGITAYFGDISDVEFLETLPLSEAEMIISTVPDPEDQKTFIRHVRRQSKKVYIIASLHHARYMKELYEAGADYIY
jgi:CPA2 family monovalent cation:H+ antiporter-2